MQRSGRDIKLQRRSDRAKLSIYILKFLIKEFDWIAIGSFFFLFETKARIKVFPNRFVKELKLTFNLHCHQVLQLFAKISQDVFGIVTFHNSNSYTVCG